MKFRSMMLALLLGCATGPLGPEEPVWGKQACDHCAMLLSDPAPAAQAVLADRSRKYFDDVGCLAAYLAMPGVTAAAAWVHVPGGRWGNALTARYASGHVTPMDYGYMAAHDGLSFSEVQTAVASKNAAREAAR